MEGIVSIITDMTAQIKAITGGMTGVYGGLVALALLGIIFTRIGK